MTRRCQECGETKPMVEFKKAEGKYRRYCNDCRSAKRRDQAARAIEARGQVCLRCDEVRPLGEYVSTGKRRGRVCLTCRTEDRECRACGETKPSGEFTDRGHEIRRTCDGCRKAQQRERYASSEEMREKAQAAQRQWYQENRDKDRAYRRSPAGRRSKFKAYLKRHYGMTPEEWDARLIAQSGRCAICSEPMAVVHVDHCHEGGHVRGMLCSGCNTGIGLLGDDVDRLRSAIEYLAASGAFVPEVAGG